MKLAITFAPINDDWQAAVRYAIEAERLGIDMAWTAETWGYDGATAIP
jgi:alkanesulfonate monooxygenase SsuD/methylene tetrahydromethanopterin reductase-like flavin-dependent oxidoreductase (luciferase family)